MSDSSQSLAIFVPFACLPMMILDARAGRIMVDRQHLNYFFGIFVPFIQSLPCMF
jgi:hypothetical protein